MYVYGDNSNPHHTSAVYFSAKTVILDQKFIVHQGVQADRE